MSSPMPKRGLPRPIAGLPDYTGGHPATGSLLSVPPSPVKKSLDEPPTRDALNASTTFAKKLYGPEYWREWSTEAVISTELALHTVLAGDHEEQVGCEGADAKCRLRRLLHARPQLLRPTVTTVHCCVPCVCSENDFGAAVSGSCRLRARRQRA